VCEDRHPVDGVYELTVMALDELARETDPRRASAYFMMAALDLLGYAPQLVTCASCVLSMLSFVITLLLPAALLMVITTRRFGAAFEFGRVFAFISQNIGNYVMALVTELVAYVLSFAGLGLLCVGIFFTSFWGVLVTGYAFANTYALGPQR